MTITLSDAGAEFAQPRLTIRPAKGIDAPAVAAMRSRWSASAYASPAFVNIVRTWLEAEGEARITLIASLETQPIGMISMLEHRAMPTPGASSARWGDIGHLFVDEDHRRDGIATALINELIDMADRRRYSRLLVFPSDMSLPLFHKLGFLMTDEMGPEGILLLRPRSNSRLYQSPA